MTSGGGMMVESSISCCAMRLLEAGAEVDATATMPAGVTPLMLAVRGGNAPVVTVLMAARADPARTSAKGNSPLSLAKDKKGDDAAAVLELLNKGTAVACGGDDDSLGIGVATMPPGWEGVRCRVLYNCRLRSRNPRVWLRLSCVPKDAPPDAGAAAPWDSAPRLVIELWADVVPKTADNFRCLCTGEKGKCSVFGSPPLCYKGNRIHRIVEGQVFQGGDITSGDGRGGESIYGRTFADESFAGRAGSHHAKGLLSMANSGRNSNGSQFFVTLGAMPHLDGKHVVFGAVLSGMEFLDAIAADAASGGGVPQKRVTIEDCGCLETEA